MIIRCQILLFLAMGILAWNGVEDMLQTTKSDAQVELFMAMTLQGIQHIKVREL